MGIFPKPLIITVEGQLQSRIWLNWGDGGGLDLVADCWCKYSDLRREIFKFLTETK